MAIYNPESNYEACRPPRTIKWTPYIIEKAKELIASGATRGEIADILGCTRNSVIGKLHRLGIRCEKRTAATQGGRPGGVKEYKPRVRKQAPAGSRRPHAVESSQPQPGGSEPAPCLPAASIEMNPCDIWDLTNRRCKWIEGDPRQSYFFCGAPSKDGSSYCKSHHKRVWERPRHGTGFIPE